MTYPLSSEVTSGQPTRVTDYNNLRRDALMLSNADVDSQNLAGFLNRHFEHMSIIYLATNRLRVPHQINQPPTLMINGYMLQASANVDLPSSQFTGVACTWYIFAVRSAGSKTFTLAVNTAAAEATDQRLIGECYWDGSNIDQSSIKCYFLPVLPLSTADYDSGWFGVTYNTTYTKAHSLGARPRLIQVYFCSSSTGTGIWILVSVVNNNGLVSNIGSSDASNIYLITGTSSSYAAVVCSTSMTAISGYYRVLAWK